MMKISKCVFVFEGIAKTNTTHTSLMEMVLLVLFEGIAKTNTTHTGFPTFEHKFRLRVLLKQIQHTQKPDNRFLILCLRVLLKQIQHTHEVGEDKTKHCLRVLLKQIQHTLGSNN